MITLKSLAVSAFILLVFLVNGANGQKKAFTAKINKEGTQVIEMKAGDYYFSPNRITVKINVPVEIKVIRKSEYVTHNIVLKAPEAGININESMPFVSELKTIKFTPTKTGKYLFYCDRKVFFFMKHRSKGMQGVLKVIE
jgi:plastocyanin domain-containing protein